MKHVFTLIWALVGYYCAYKVGGWYAIGVVVALQSGVEYSVSTRKAREE